MFIRAAGLFLTLTLAVVSVAEAQPPAAANSADVEKAKARYKVGVVHYNLDEWEKAVVEFKEAYRLHPDPTFLYNIALCHRKMGQNAEALSFYRKFLRERPDAPNRDQVAKQIDELEAAVEAQKRTREAQPSAVLPPPPPVAPTPVTPAPAPAPSSLPLASAPPPSLPEAPPPSRSVPDVAVSAAPSDAPPESPPLYKRWYFWAGVGAVVVAGVVTGVALASSGGGSTPYQGDLNPGRITVPTR